MDQKTLAFMLEPIARLRAEIMNRALHTVNGVR